MNRVKWIAMLICLVCSQAVAQQYWLLPTVPTPNPIVWRPVIVAQPLQYQGTFVVPRATYFGNRWLGPVIFNQYAPAPQQPAIQSPPSPESEK